jgi:pantothenate synthetase
MIDDVVTAAGDVVDGFEKAILKTTSMDGHTAALAYVAVMMVLDDIGGLAVALRNELTDPHQRAAAMEIYGEILGFKDWMENISVNVENMPR